MSATSFDFSNDSPFHHARGHRVLDALFECATSRPPGRWSSVELPIPFTQVEVAYRRCPWGPRNCPKWGLTPGVQAIVSERACLRLADAPPHAFPAGTVPYPNSRYHVVAGHQPLPWAKNRRSGHGLDLPSDRWDEDMEEALEFFEPSRDWRRYLSWDSHEVAFEHGLVWFSMDTVPGQSIPFLATAREWLLIHTDGACGHMVLTSKESAATLPYGCAVPPPPSWSPLFPVPRTIDYPEYSWDTVARVAPDRWYLVSSREQGKPVVFHPFQGLPGLYAEVEGGYLVRASHGYTVFALGESQVTLYSTPPTVTDYVSLLETYPPDEYEPRDICRAWALVRGLIRGAGPLEMISWWGQEACGWEQAPTDVSPPKWEGPEPGAVVRGVVRGDKMYVNDADQLCGQPTVAVLLRDNSDLFVALLPLVYSDHPPGGLEIEAIVVWNSSIICRSMAEHCTEGPAKNRLASCYGDEARITAHQWAVDMTCYDKGGYYLSPRSPHWKRALTVPEGIERGVRHLKVNSMSPQRTLRPITRTALPTVSLCFPFDPLNVRTVLTAEGPMRGLPPPWLGTGDNPEFSPGLPGHYSRYEAETGRILAWPNESIVILVGADRRPYYKRLCKDRSVNPWGMDGASYCDAVAAATLGEGWIQLLLDIKAHTEELTGIPVPDHIEEWSTLSEFWRANPAAQALFAGFEGAVEAGLQ